MSLLLNPITRGAVSKNSWKRPRSSYMDSTQQHPQKTAQIHTRTLPHFRNPLTDDGKKHFLPSVNSPPLATFIE